MPESEVEKPNTTLVTDEHMHKHRRMKRTLVQFIARHKESISKLEDATNKIKVLRKKNRKLKRKLVKKSENETNTSQTDDDNDDSENDSENSSNDDDSEEEDDDDSEETESGPEQFELDSDDNEYTERYVRRGGRSTRKRRRGPSLIDIKKDEDGKPILPIHHGLFKIIALGVINYKDPNFHNERYIFPVGYTVERTYSSMVDPDHQTEYLCKVLADDAGPLFTIVPKDDPDTLLSGRTPTSCWGMVIRAANKVRNKSSCRNAISGPEYFGFTNPLIRSLIEGLGNVDQCKKYIPN